MLRSSLPPDSPLLQGPSQPELLGQLGAYNPVNAKLMGVLNACIGLAAGVARVYMIILLGLASCGFSVL